MTQTKKTNSKGVFRLEEHLMKDAPTDALQLRRQYGMTFTELRKEINKARKRGFPIIYANDLLYMANTKAGFERALVKMWDKNVKLGIVEYRGKEK